MKIPRLLVNSLLSAANGFVWWIVLRLVCDLFQVTSEVTNVIAGVGFFFGFIVVFIMVGICQGIHQNDAR